MTFEEILPYLKAGKKITRENDDQFIYFMDDDKVHYIDTEFAPDEVGVENTLWIEDILADDWIIVDED